MNCDCFRNFFCANTTDQPTYPDIINKYKFIRDKLRQSNHEDSNKLLFALVQARDCLLYEIFGSKTGMLLAPILRHNCQKFHAHRLTLRKIVLSIMTDEDIVQYPEFEPPNLVSAPVDQSRALGPQHHSNFLQPSIGNESMENACSSESERLTFRRKVKLITKHFYRPKGTTFKVIWAGFDLPPMEEPLEMVMERGKGALKKYLERCSKRALTTLLRRHPEIGNLLLK